MSPPPSNLLDGPVNERPRRKAFCIKIHGQESSVITKILLPFKYSGALKALGLSIGVLMLAACGTGTVPAEPSTEPTAAAQQTPTQTSTATASPTATATPAPTVTPLPILQLLPTALAKPRATRTPGPATASATPSPPSEARLLAERLSSEGLDYLTTFLDEFSPRASGTQEELDAAEFLRDEMAELGYHAVLQELSAERLSREQPFLSVTAGATPEEREIRALPMSNTGMGDVGGPIIFVQKAFEEDIPETGLTDFVALIERGQITFQQKVAQVAEAGAVAAVVFNNEPGGFRGALADISQIPAVSITREDGLELLDILDAGEEIIADIFVQTESIPSQNVIADKPGTEPDGGVVIIGAHYDTVPDTQAANDNSTGVTSLVLMARELQDREFPFTLRFVFFGVEELGLFGSRHFVDSLTDAERSEIIAMLNFDSVGAGEAAVIGDSDLVNQAMDYSNANGLFITTTPGSSSGGSDHVPFQRAGIPALFLFGDDLSRINSPGDTLEFVDPDIMGRQMALGLALLDMLAEPK